MSDQSIDSARTQQVFGGERDANHNWKGGRVIASNGYVLIKVGFDHHLADVRGYAYEHRLVAEQKIGRRLLPGEQVHHIDENKQNNHPDNLEVVSGIAEHRVRHRRSGLKRRLPGEDNPTVACACGCGTTFEKYDSSGRPREYVTGHNTQGNLREYVILYLHSVPEPSTTRYMADFMVANEGSVRNVLSRLKKEGVVVRKPNGEWRLTSA